MGHYDDLLYKEYNTKQKEVQQEVVHLDTQYEEEQLDLFQQVHCYLPSLEGYIGCGVGVDEQDSKENYLLSICTLIQELESKKVKIMYGVEDPVYVTVAGG